MVDLEFLRKLRARLADPNKWQQGSLGRPGERMCLMGHALVLSGLWFHGFDIPDEPSANLGSELCEALRIPIDYAPICAVTFWNDSHITHRKLLRTLDDAIARYEELERGDEPVVQEERELVPA